MKVLCACGNGMGTSLMIKLKAEAILNELGIEDLEVNSCSISEAGSIGGEYDVILCPDQLVENFSLPNTVIIGLENVIDGEEITGKLQAYLAKRDG